MARAGIRNRIRRLTGTQRVWVLIAVIAAAAVGLGAPLLRLGDLDAPVSIPWWAIALMVYGAEMAVVHLRFRRDAHSFSMSEIPLAIGLFFSAPWQLLLGQLLGNIAVLRLNRRQPAIKLAFNLGQFTLVAVVMIHVFRFALRFGDPLGPAGWSGALIGALLALGIVHLLINSAIRLSGGRIDRVEIFDVLTLGIFASSMNVGLALVGINLLWQAPSAAWLAIVPPVVLFLAYRAYVNQREERARLESLYEATRVLHSSPQIEEALVAAAEHARSMFDAEFAQILVFPEGLQAQAYRTVVGPGNRKVVMDPVDLAEEHPLWSRLLRSGEPMLFHEARNPEVLEVAHGETAIEEAIAAPLTAEGGVVGAMVVANQLGDISSFGDQDLKMLATMASQVSVSLENGRLEDSLAELTQLKEELRHQALHDSLTELANRTLFTEHVEHALRRSARGEHSVAVLFLDLDDFKTVNDSLGHHAGDDLLIAVANRLRVTCRPGDSIARLGGDEFAVLLEGVAHPGEAVEVGERIIRRLAIPFQVEDQEISVRASIGIAFGSYSQEPSQLLRNADAAMYAAKRRGKGQCRVFEAGMHAEMIRRLEMQGELERALEREEMSVQFQPIVVLDTGEIVGFEALVRWGHPRQGQILPADFVPFAEETGLIVPLGRWVLDEACRQAAQWNRSETRTSALMVSVNLSPRQLTSPDLVDVVGDTLTRYRLDPKLLVLEITENVVMQEGVLEVLEALKALGVGLAIDDFGTGYSSLSYLDRLPVDIIKIDRSFVERLGEEGESPLVRTVVGLGESLGLRTVVEGIETREQFDQLRQLGCPLGQGFYMAEPLTVDALETLFPAAEAEGEGAIRRRYLRAVG